MLHQVATSAHPDCVTDEQATQDAAYEADREHRRMLAAEREERERQHERMVGRLCDSAREQIRRRDEAHERETGAAALLDRAVLRGGVLEQTDAILKLLAHFGGEDGFYSGSDQHDLAQRNGHLYEIIDWQPIRIKSVAQLQNLIARAQRGNYGSGVEFTNPWLRFEEDADGGPTTGVRDAEPCPAAWRAALACRLARCPDSGRGAGQLRAQPRRRRGPGRDRRSPHHPAAARSDGGPPAMGDRNHPAG